MSDFGWAYISGSNAGGVNDSVQIKVGQGLSGSENFTYNIGTSTVALTGTLNVSGTVNANAFNLDVTNKNVTNLTVTGSSKFGDSADDIHEFTGSILVSNSVSASTSVSSSFYYGDGSKLSGITAASVTSPLSVAIITGSTEISGAAAFFGTVTADTFSGTVTKATVTDSTANTAFPVVFHDESNGLLDDTGTFTYNPNSATLSATNIAGTLSTAAQTNVTSVGTLTSLGVTGDLTVDTDTLKVDSSNNRVGIGRADPQKTLEVLKADDTQLRLSYSKFVFGVSSNVNTDLKTLSSGIFEIKPTGLKVHVSGSITGSALKLTALSAGTATTSSYLALDSNNNVVLTSSSGGGGGSGGSIGAAEDGDYTDGLFTDFTTSTAIGTTIDRFNEVLKILAPSPAPAVSSINEEVTDGVTAKLSFGASNAVTDYTSSATAAGFPAVGRTGIYSASVEGNNIRLGVYDGTQDITGFINHSVTELISNGNTSYSNDAFGNANEGTLKLELNGTVIHSVSLSGLVGAGNPNSGSANSLTGQSGFTNVSVTASSFDGNGAEWYIFKHRTAKYKVDTNEQKVGWNYIRVIHSLTTDNTTNFIEWINDPSGAVNDLSITNGRIENVSLAGSKYLSGVEYNTDATANYKGEINNLYRNVYAASGTPISFTVSNSTTPSAQSVPDIGGSENNTKVLGITASLDFNGSTLFSGSITCNTTVTHPLKNTISNQGAATTGNGFLIDNRSLASTNEEEKFHDETFRKTSGSYDSQAATVNAASVWNSQNHMTGGGATGHTDGLLFHNQRLYSPVDGDVPHGGNFAALSNVESGQPNYSGVTGMRTFYRIVSNSAGATKRDMKIVSTKNSTTYNNATLGASNVHFFAKIPGATGWMDISQNFSYGSTDDGDGALINGASNDVDSGNNTHFITFGTQSVASNERVMIKILADESWGGYISELSFSVGATSNTAVESLALDDIDLDDTAGETAKLSFGTSNGITGYTNVAGGVGSMGAVNSNGTYTDNGDTNRGVFKVAEVMGGTLNEDVSANGNNYTANSFKNAFTGSLLLIVNDTTASTLSLANLSSNNNLSSNTGFSVGAVGFSTTSDNIPDYTKPYRTGTYSIGTGQQRSGWNYARVIHRIGTSDTLTNYVQWVVDPSGSTDNTAVSSPTISNFGHTSVYYQSGIGYFATNPTGSFQFSGSNFYSNVYSTDAAAISFPTTTNCAATNIAVNGTGLTNKSVSAASTTMAALDNSANCELTTIQVTGTMQYNGSTPSISGGLGLFTARDVSVTGRLLHPFKTDKTTAAGSKTAFMVYSGSIGSTTLTNNEYFNTETYRIVSGNYDNQAELTSSTNVWNSQTHMNAANAHGDGMVSANGYVFSPLQIGNDGDTRSSADGGSLQAPDGNPNYSTLSENVRTFYRRFQYTGASTVASFTMTLYGDANLVGKAGTYAAALGANKNCFVELKVPFDPNFPGADDQSTAFADAARIFESGNQPNNEGAGIRAGSFSGEDQTIDGGGLALSLTLGTRRIKQNQHFIVKISAHKDWTGYISRIQVAY